MTGLNAEEVRLVLEAVGLPPALRPRFSAATETGLELGGDEADLVLELVSDRLMTHGFDAAYRPTDEGRALERLIDRLSAEDDSGEASHRGS